MKVDTKLELLERLSAKAPANRLRSSGARSGGATIRRWKPSNADVLREPPGVSKATVYRARNNLVQLGLARRVPHDRSVARFDGNVTQHHHLVCTQCRGIRDIALDGESEIPLPTIARDDFEVHGVAVSFRGNCRACATPSKR